MAKQNQGQPGQAQVIYVKGKDHGCLMGMLVFLVFGLPGLVVMGGWKLTKLAWRWTTTVGLKWPARAVKMSWVATLALCVWCWQGSRAGTRWTVARIRALVAARRNDTA